MYQMLLKKFSMTSIKVKGVHSHGVSTLIMGTHFFLFHISNTLQLNCGKSTHCNMDNELEGRRSSKIQSIIIKKYKASCTNTVIWVHPLFPALAS